MGRVAAVTAAGALGFVAGGPAGAALAGSAAAALTRGNGAAPSTPPTPSPSASPTPSSAPSTAGTEPEEPYTAGVAGQTGKRADNLIAAAAAPESCEQTDAGRKVIKANEKLDANNVSLKEITEQIKIEISNREKVKGKMQDMKKALLAAQAELAQLKGTPNQTPEIQQAVASVASSVDVCSSIIQEMEAKIRDQDGEIGSLKSRISTMTQMTDDEFQILGLEKEAV